MESAYINSLTKQIEKDINTCLAYQKQSPDLLAEDRVNFQTKCPVSGDFYFVNLTLDESEVTKNTDLTERLKHEVNKIVLLGTDDYDNCFESRSNY